MKIFNIFKKKPEAKVTEKEGSKTKKTILIESLINHHFCIKSKDSAQILKAIKTTSIENILFDSKFNWDFLFSEENESKKRFILFESINNWSYLRWNVWDFEENKKIIVRLSKELETEVNYLFIDPWIATARWIHAKNGNLIRVYYQSHSEIIEQSGNLEIENEIVKRNNKGLEGKYWEISEALNPSIEMINTKTEINATIGEVK